MLNTPEYSSDVKNDLKKWSEPWWIAKEKAGCWQWPQLFDLSSQAHLYPMETHYMSWKFSLSTGPHADLCERDFSGHCESEHLWSSLIHFSCCLWLPNMGEKRYLNSNQTHIVRHRHHRPSRVVTYLNLKAPWILILRRVSLMHSGCRAFWSLRKITALLATSMS